MSSNIISFSGSLSHTGSILVTGSLNAPSITGSLSGTASWSELSVSASYFFTSSVTSASLAQSASYVNLVAGQNIDIANNNGEYIISSLGGEAALPDDVLAWRYPVANDIYPVTQSFTGSVYTVTNQTELTSAIASAVTGDVIKLGADIDITSTVTINKTVKIEGNNFAIQTVSGSTAPVTAVSVTANGVYFDSGLTIKHRKTTNTSVETAVSLVANDFVSYANVEFMEFGYVLKGNFSIYGKTTYTGALGNNHRHIGIYNISAPSQIDGVLYDFPNEAVARASFIYLSSNNATTEQFNDVLRVANTAQLVPSNTQRQFYLQDTFVTASGRQPSLLFQNNSFNDLNGGIGFFSSAGSPLDFYKYVVIDNNTQGNAGSGSYKGLVYFDGSGATRPLGSRTQFYYTTNYHLSSSTRVDYLSALDSWGVAYKPAQFSNVPALVSNPLFATASFATFALSASWAPSQTIDTSSFVLNSQTSSMSVAFAQTASYVSASNIVTQNITFSSIGDYPDDVTAAAAGIPVGGVYRNGNFLMIRLA